VRSWHDLVRQHEGDLIEAGLSEAAGRLSAMAKVPAVGMRLRHQGLERGAEHDGCGGRWFDLVSAVPRRHGENAPRIALEEGLGARKRISAPMAARRPAAAPV